MKRIWTCLLVILLLAGCGAKPEPAPEADRAPEGERAESAAPRGTFSLEVEREVYDPSVKQVWFLLTNGGADAEIGTEYGLEVQKDGVWTPVPFKENVGWDALALLVPAGESVALCCHFSMFDCAFEAGTYRVVKDGTAGEFRLEEGAAVSAARPYGFMPLEDLPADYGAANAPESNVAFTREGMENGGAVEEFLDKVRLGVPCQLRTVQDYGEGSVMVIDAVYENGCFLWRMWDGWAVTEQRFSYIVTDGTDLYFSNGADWDAGERYGDRRVFLLPEGKADGEMVKAVEQMTADRLAGNMTRYRVWSGDGIWDAALTDAPTEFSVGWQKPGEGGGGRTYDLQDWDGLETAIRGLEWREDGKLCMTCETADGGTSRLVFDPELERMVRS